MNTNGHVLDGKVVAIVVQLKLIACVVVISVLYRC